MLTSLKVTIFIMTMIFSGFTFATTTRLPFSPHSRDMETRQKEMSAVTTVIVNTFINNLSEFENGEFVDEFFNEYTLSQNGPNVIIESLLYDDAPKHKKDTTMQPQTNPFDLVNQDFKATKRFGLFSKTDYKPDQLTRCGNDNELPGNPYLCKTELPIQMFEYLMEKKKNNLES
jgi:hypothetical protein